MEAGDTVYFEHQNGKPGIFSGVILDRVGSVCRVKVCEDGAEIYRWAGDLSHTWRAATVEAILWRDCFIERITADYRYNRPDYVEWREQVEQYRREIDGLRELDRL